MEDNAATVDVAELLRAGRFAEARTALAEVTTPSALLERVRVHFHFSEYVDAERAARAAAAATDDPAVRSLAHTMVKAAQAGQGLPDESPLDIEDLQGRELSASLYYVAVAAYWRHDFRAVDAWLSTHAPKDPVLRARYLILRGFAAAGAGDVAKHLEFSDAAARILRAEAPEEVYLLASVAFVMALLLRELPWQGHEYIEELEQQLPWPPDLEMWRFHILRGIGWKRALSGAYLDAMRYLLEATLHTGDGIRRAYALLDRASIAIFANERVTASSEFTVAVGILDSIDWKTVKDETLLVLPYAAQVAAELNDSLHARRFFELAARLRGGIDPRWAFAHGERFDAFLSEAAAFTFYDSKRKRAIREAERAYEIFARIGYAWRAGRLAVLLYSATHDVDWHARAEEWLGYYPNSPLQRLLPGKSARRKTVRPLSPRQREVFRLMRQGKTGTEIAAELGISTLTVRNHEQAVMRYYKVHRRYDLRQMAE
ncbi:MAG TPA: LuxR C-terminal-related transcriptional regulator [Candidatus Baltobacteraceae bacterium]|jgi:DNA-binding CsgD family transcriptional regulator